jgi:hypothetical protein
MMGEHSEPVPKTGSLQLSLRTLFLLMLALAVLLAAYKSCRFVRGIGGLEFWIVLLMPLWLLLPFSRDTTTRGKLRPLLSIIPISWYVVMQFPPWAAAWPRGTPYVLERILNGAILLGGTAFSLVALARSARGRQHLITLPLWIAILAGTVSLLLGIARW